MEKAHRLTGVAAVLRRVPAYSDKVFDLHDQCREVRDFRLQPQNYHRMLAFHVLAEDFRLLLDAELIRRGKDELADASRTTGRVLRGFLRSFEILTGAALYAGGPLVNLLRQSRLWWDIDGAER